MSGVPIERSMISTPAARALVLASSICRNMPELGVLDETHLRPAFSCFCFCSMDQLLLQEPLFANVPAHMHQTSVCV